MGKTAVFSWGWFWLGHERSDSPLSIFMRAIGKFAKPFVANVALLVDEIGGGPEALFIRIPGDAIVVDCNRIGDAKLFGGL